MALTVEDRLAILELVAAYNYAADMKDVEGTVALYTEDGQIEGLYRTERGGKPCAAIYRASSPAR